MVLTEDRAMRDFIDRWYGDGCPSWTWPLTTAAGWLMVCVVLYMLPRS
jgi:hypothetical protein